MISLMTMPAFILALIYIESTSQVLAFQPCYNVAKNKRNTKLTSKVDYMNFSTNPSESTNIERAQECAKSMGECSIEELEQLRHGECYDFSN